MKTTRIYSAIALGTAIALSTVATGAYAADTTTVTTKLTPAQKATIQAQRLARSNAITAELRAIALGKNNLANAIENATTARIAATTAANAITDATKKKAALAAANLAFKNTVTEARAINTAVQKAAHAANDSALVAAGIVKK
jgi:hypothetical protein